LLTNKTILIVSPQAWGKMMLSKHHYAIELAKKGNQVYFLNPPDASNRERVSIIAADTPGLLIVNHRLFFPYNLKFHAPAVFYLLMQWQVKKIISIINKPLDIIWSFDLGNIYPFRFFPSRALKVFHPVDEPVHKTAFSSAVGAQVIFSVTKEILQQYDYCKLPSFLINHGLCDVFLEQHPTGRPAGDLVRVGYAGNLMRGDIDRPVMLKIILENPAVIFECWGSYNAKQGNIGGSDNQETQSFITALSSCSNVILHGAVSTGTLAAEMQRMDAFLICYDINKDHSKGTNYHKIMEYLSTGRVIVSNNTTAYHNMPRLLQMTAERNNNDKLPDLFSSVISNLDFHNSEGLRSERCRFAKENTYKKQVERIEEKLSLFQQQIAGATV
jgi:hypothetical protein